MTVDAFTPGHELARRIQAREVSPREAIDFFLQRIRELNPRLHALLTIAEDGAVAAADRASDELSRGGEVGPLHGVPFVVKDLEWTQGIRTTMGSLVYRDFVPREDSIAVERLRRSGAIVIGKGNACEFGMHLETKNRLGPDTRNPWDTALSSGGSSGGSAVAVAAGLAPLATGSDSAGSIGNPSGLCGVVGVKPSHGRVPLWPDPGDSRLLLDTGVITRTVLDAALMLSVMAGEDRRDPVSIRGPAPDYATRLAEPVGRLRVGWSTDFSGYPVDREVREIVLSAVSVFEALGHRVEVGAPDIDGSFYDTFTPLYLADEHVGFDELLSRRPGDLDPDTRIELENARRVTLPEYVRALHRRAQFCRAVEEFFSKYDLLITPNNPVPAFPALDPPASIDGHVVARDWTPHLAFLAPWNLSGNPWITVPAGLSRAGLPVGVLLVAAIGREDLLFAAAAAFERERPWSTLIPPIAAGLPAAAFEPALASEAAAPVSTGAPGSEAAAPVSTGGLA
jgi:Asp-tRNA(Asn)/Glu-tRNA(Gln) amidotransferase A subunit family amidase